MEGDGEKTGTSPGKDDGEKNASPASSNNSKVVPPPPPPEEAKEEEHVSGPPVKQSLFGKMKAMSVSARDSLKDLKKSYLPGKDVGDVAEPGDDGEDRPKTATKTRTSTDDDGPVWEPGTEQLRWTDPTYKVEKFIQPGIHPNHNKNFVKPEAWWNRCGLLLLRLLPCPSVLFIVNFLQCRRRYEDARERATRSQTRISGSAEYAGKNAACHESFGRNTSWWG